LTAPATGARQDVVTGPAAAAGDRGSSAYERGTSTAPHRPGRDTSRNIDEIAVLEQAIVDDPILSRVYHRLTAGGWRISRLALAEPYRLDHVGRTITFDARLDASRIPAIVAAAVRLAYSYEPALRRLSIRGRVLELLNNRATAGAALTDLEIMAQAYTWSAWFASSGGKPSSRVPFTGIMADLLRVLSGQRSAGLWRDVRERDFTTDTTYFVGNQFRSTGFKREFRDTSNQVRHATAVLTLYALFGTWQGRKRVQEREKPGVDFADIRLNERLVTIVRVFAASWFPFPEEFGDFIRQELGDPTEVAPWPEELEHGLPDVGD
jgi:hypothetical protein